jgi:cell wall-associated NlpC family hydrolase
MAAVAATTASGTSGIDAKRAEANQVLGEIAQIDGSLERAIDAYNGAQLKLAAIETKQTLNARHLGLARQNYQRARQAISKRLVSLYKSGESSLAEVLLGATSLGDLVDRVDAADRISAQDAEIVHDLRSARIEMRLRGRELKRQHVEQKHLVAERAGKKAYIEGQLRERQRLLASIKDEIQRLEAEEAARQRRLQALAEARLAAAQAAAQEAARAAQAASESAPADSTITEPAPADAAAPDVASASPSADTSVVTEPPAPAPASPYGGAVGIAMQYLGVPYVWGGASPSGFDCSGFVMYVFAQVGVSLPHHAASQFNYGVSVSRDELQPGDLVFFDGLGHVGIYIGGGQFIHAPHTGDVVKISSIYDSWYAGSWVGAKRIL